MDHEIIQIKLASAQRPVSFVQFLEGEKIKSGVQNYISADYFTMHSKGLVHGGEKRAYHPALPLKPESTMK